jgi:hypothetical protein
MAKPRLVGFTLISEENAEAGLYEINYEDGSARRATLNARELKVMKERLDKNTNRDIMPKTDTAETVASSTGDTAPPKTVAKSKGDTAPSKSVATPPVKKSSKSWIPQGTERAVKLRPELDGDYVLYFAHRDNVEASKRAGYEVVQANELVDFELQNNSGKNLDAPVTHNEHVLVKLHKDAYAQMMKAQAAKVSDPLNKNEQLKAVTNSSVASENMTAAEKASAMKYLHSDIRVTRTAGFQ